MLFLEEGKRHTDVVKIFAIYSTIVIIIGSGLLLTGLWLEYDHCQQVSTECNVTAINGTCYWQVSSKQNDIFSCVYQSFQLNKYPFMINCDSEFVNGSTISRSFLVNCTYDPNRYECPTSNCRDPSPLSITPILTLIGITVLVHPVIAMIIFCIFCLPYMKRFSPTVF